MGSPYSAKVQKTPSKQSSDPDEEDLRRLGYSIKQDKGAVPIRRPGSLHASNMLKPGPMGPRPVNTLATSRNLPSKPTPRHAANPAVQEGRLQGLTLQSSRGNNVDVVGHRRGSDPEISPPPSAKRRKTGHSHSPITNSSDESIDKLQPDSVSFKRSRCLENPTSSHSQGSEPRNLVMPLTGGRSEFRSVERRMDSSARYPKRHNGNIVKTSSSSPFKGLSRSNSWETKAEGEKKLTMAKTDARPTYEGTLGKPPHSNGNNVVVKSKQIQTSKTESRFFSNQPALPTRPAAASEAQRAPDNPSSHLHGDNMRGKFVTTIGKLRGLDNLSSDELEGPATIGEHADVVSRSPGKRQQSSVPKNVTSPMESSIFLEKSFEIERGNIKPTVFQSKELQNGKTKRPKDFEAAYLEERPVWSIPLVALVLPGQKDDMLRGRNMGLVFEEPPGDYFVKNEGRYMSDGPWKMRIKPRSVLKIHMEHSGAKVRFESSKNGHENTVLDLELGSEKSMVDLVARIQQSSANVNVSRIDSEKMHRMFKKRLMSARAATGSTDDLEDIPDDVRMIARNQQRREAREVEATETVSAKRKRTRLSDGMDDHSSREQAEVSATTSNLYEPKVNGFHEHPPTSSQGDAITKSEFFSNLRNNDRLRRSTRKSGISARLPGDSFDNFEEPKIEKYSKVYGLGNPWTKPLSYPKVGKKKATVEWDDLERLDEGEFLNDNLVSFYMRYLEENLQKNNPDLAKKVYFFNSFFYDRLTTLQKGQRGINYEGVQRWTKGVDLFGLDYVIVPVNELTHWYVAIICNLPALDRSVALSDDPEMSDAATAQDQPAASAQLNEELKNAVDEMEILDPVEKDTHESFAELSLESKQQGEHFIDDTPTGDHNVTDDQDPATREDDEEMLDVPQGPTEAGRTTTLQLQEVVQPEGNDEADPIEEIGEAPKILATSKMQKRKSVPPITKIDPNKPIIITFDSFGHPHSHVVKILKLYLQEEGKAKRHGMEFNVASIKGVTAKNIPQQKNFSDCGLFMLGYIEKCLQDDPHEFIAKIIKREHDDHKDWPKMKPSLMRTSLRQQLQRLHDEQQDERRLLALKAGKYHAGSRADKDAALALVKPPKEARQLTDNQELKTHEAALMEALPIDKPSAPLNGKYQNPKTVEEDRSKLFSEPGKPFHGADPVADTSLDASLIMLESTPARKETTDSNPQTDIPSSVPLQSATPPQQNDMPGSFPRLPSEIEDSQPESTSSRPKTKTSKATELTLSPEPQSPLQKKGTAAGQFNSNWSPPKPEEARYPPNLIPISIRRQRRPHIASAQPGTEKAVEKEVIDIDDD